MRTSISEHTRVPCRYCGSSEHVIRKGKRRNNGVRKQVFRCKTCARNFSQQKTSAKLPEDALKTYLTEATNLNVAAQKFKLPRTTFYRRLREQARESPDWRDLLNTRERRENGGLVIGVDTTYLKVKGVKKVYLHVADVILHDPLAYEICEKEDAATIKSVLRQLLDVGYDPEFAVCDLAPELLDAIGKISPMAKIQGCLFHLAEWLDKELPTLYSTRDVGKEQVALWRKFKDLVKCTAISKNEATRQQYLEKLRQLNLDEKAKNVFDRFLSNLKYYHTLDQINGYETNILYNNCCENHIGMIKNLAYKMRGFKSNDAARDFINFFWFLRRGNQSRLPEIDKDVSPKNMPLTSFYDSVSLAELSIASDIPIEFLYKAVQKMKYEVVGDFAFAESKLREIQDIILKMKKPSLQEVMDNAGIDRATAEQLCQRLGFRIRYKSLHPSDVEISR